MTHVFAARMGRLSFALAGLLVISACGDKESEETADASADAATTEAPAPQSVRDVFAASNQPAASSIPAGKPVVLVVNQAQIFATSKAGVDLRTKLTAIQEEIKADQDKALDELLEEIKALAQQRAILPSDQFRKQQQELIQKEDVIKFKFNREMEAAQTAGENQIMARLSPIMQQIMVERSGTVLIDQSSLMLSAPEYGITDEALKRLDEVMPTVDVTRKTFDELAKEAEERAAKRKEAQEARAAAAAANEEASE